MSNEIQGKSVLSFAKFVLGGFLSRGFLAWGFVRGVYIQGVFVRGFLSCHHQVQYTSNPVKNMLMHLATRVQIESLTMGDTRYRM